MLALSSSTKFLSMGMYSRRNSSIQDCRVYIFLLKYCGYLVSNIFYVSAYNASASFSGTLKDFFCYLWIMGCVETSN